MTIPKPPNSYLLRVEADEEGHNYLLAAARLRGLSRATLLQRVVEAVLCDQLILAVLDDGDERHEPSAYLRREYANASPWDCLKRRDS